MAVPPVALAGELTASDLEQIRPQYLQMLALLQARLNILGQQLAVAKSQGVISPVQAATIHAEFISLRRTLIPLTAITVWASNNQ